MHRVPADRGQAGCRSGSGERRGLARTALRVTAVHGKRWWAWRQEPRGNRSMVATDIRRFCPRATTAATRAGTANQDLHLTECQAQHCRAKREPQLTLGASSALTPWRSARSVLTRIHVVVALRCVPEYPGARADSRSCEAVAADRKVGNCRRIRVPPPVNRGGR